MSEKQFDIFDEQFKNAAEQHEPAFNEAAWQKMQVKLDEEERRRRPAGWIWWLSDALMLTLMVYMAITLTHHKPILKHDETNKHAVSNQLPGKAIKSTGEENSVATTTTSKAGANDKTKHSQSGKETSNDLTANSPPGKQGNNILRQPITHQQNSYTSTGKTSISKLEVEAKNPSAKNAVAINRSSDPSLNNTAAKQDNGKENVLSSAETIAANDLSISKKQNENITLQPGEPIEDNTTVAGKNIDNNTDVATKAGKEKGNAVAVKKTPLNKKGFFLHAGMAPEKSYVKGNGMGSLTLAYGGGIGYSFSNRWSVLAGIYSTQKNYVAGPNDYKAKNDNYYYNLKLYHVNAECGIIEIPLSVNFYAWQHRRQSAYVSAGFSSMIMRKEWYDYHFEHTNGSYGHADRTYHTNNIHWFAGTMLSAGYQFKVTGKFSLTAAPYVKIPLYGVGEGSVKIGSAGLMIGAIYQLPSTGKKPE